MRVFVLLSIAALVAACNTTPKSTTPTVTPPMTSATTSAPTTPAPTAATPAVPATTPAPATAPAPAPAAAAPANAQAAQGVSIPESGPVRDARVAAEQWLTLTDAGKYGESWDNAAQLFKSSVTRDKWVASLTTARTPLGAASSRTLKGAAYNTSLPNAPAGEYVTLEYTTNFAAKSGATERIVMMRGTDGIWRPAGYSVH